MALEQWQVDGARSSIGFTVRHLVVSKVHGRFGKWTATLAYDEAAPAASTVVVLIETASIGTGDRDRDNNLKSAEFFDAQKFPALTFQSTKVETAAGKLRVTGDLTMHGVTRPVVLDVKRATLGNDPSGNRRAGFSATTTINRKEFGLAWSAALETGGLLVGEKIEISLELQAIKPEAA